MPGCRRQGHAVGAGRQDQVGNEPAAGHTVRRCVSDESQLALHCHCHQHLRPRPRLLGILWSQRSLALFAIVSQEHEQAGLSSDLLSGVKVAFTPGGDSTLAAGSF